MEVSNDIILNAINRNSTDIATLIERVESVLTAHNELKKNLHVRVSKLEKRQFIPSFIALAACVAMVVMTGKGGNILAALANMM